MNNIKLYHQCGFRYQWNQDVLRLNGVGYGYIISPLNMNIDVITDIKDTEITNSFLDPQFYSLNLFNENENYISYNFYDEIDNIYDYNMQKNIIAKKCIDYQNNTDFKYIVIPTLDFELLQLNESYYDIYSNMNIDLKDSNYFNSNSPELLLLRKLILEPFTNYIKENNISKPTLYTVLFTDEMAKNDALFDGMLSMITGSQFISGVYLVPQNKRAFKRISDINYLVKIMEFIHILKENNLEVIIGYSDVESLLYTVAGADAVPLGIYENLRKYDRLKFSNSDYNGRGPNARIFSSKLLQWIEYTYLPILSDNIGLEKIFDQNEFFIETQSNDYNWHFSKPQCYKHYMLSFSKLINDLPNDLEERYIYVDNLLASANDLFVDLSDYVFFDNNNNGDHINKWRTALKTYHNKIKE